VEVLVRHRRLSAGQPLHSNTLYDEGNIKNYYFTLLAGIQFHGGNS
jgi:hypothetical protein